MKPRRVVVSVEVETALPTDRIKELFNSVLAYEEGFINTEQIQVNVIKKGKKSGKAKKSSR